MRGQGSALDRALEAALEQLRAAAHGVRARGGLTVRAPAPGVDPLDLLARASEACDAWFWRSPDGPVFAALGRVGETLRAGPGRFYELTHVWREGRPSSPLALCGFSFHPDGPRSEAWRPYPAGVLFLPRLLLVGSGAEATLLLTLDGSEDADGLLRDAERWLAGPSSSDDSPPAVEARPVPEPGRWKDLVRAAAEAVRGGELRKVVLARALRLRAERVQVLRVLSTLCTRYPECTVFGVKREGRWFLGATPERLLRVQEGVVEAMALAGSAPRGRSEEEDRILGRGLVGSQKDREEHRIVAEYIRERLQPFCETLRVTGPALLRTGAVQHLCTRIRGTLRGPLPALELAGALHPTPAVAGLPLDRALRWIEREGVDRGWYAGILGWMDVRGEGEMVVGIRSALVAGTEAWVYAGCGILGDSDPATEYAESELKMGPMLEALAMVSPGAILGGVQG
ncbi:MAG: isochorismate synthase [Armatimonadota bacterium]|nr:isochorismate synthase [Armatimonadota bacterium]MDR7443729.1 isochorismate synthase [Armatimonadota bacterium]MDR7569926.1 isochorismate synthase [Armatimonadota bacterium]MDR7613743.1 isochorismate synthase [Armatimonadota bacterium]